MSRGLMRALLSLELFIYIPILFPDYSYFVYALFPFVFISPRIWLGHMARFWSCAKHFDAGCCVSEDHAPCKAHSSCTKLSKYVPVPTPLNADLWHFRVCGWRQAIATLMYVRSRSMYGDGRVEPHNLHKNVLGTNSACGDPSSTRVALDIPAG